MTAYEVEYVDHSGYQGHELIEADSEKEAGVEKVNSDGLSLSEAQQITVRVYKSGNPEDAVLFEAENLL